MIQSDAIISYDVPRADPEVGKGIQLLNEHLVSCGGDIAKAWQNLGSGEQKYIDGELERCFSDPRYYLENYHVVQTEHQGLKTLAPFWDSQEIFYDMFWDMWAAGGTVKICVLKARQLGISTISEGLIFWRTIFTPNCTALIVGQDPTTADFQFSMSRLAYDSLPWWMRPEARYQAKGRYLILDKSDDVERQLRPGLRSQILVEAANKMSGVARGKTIRAAHFTELASWEDGGILAEQIFPSMNAPDAIAIMESTAEGRHGFWWRFWRACEAGREEFRPLFIPPYRRVHYQKAIPPGEAFELTAEERAVKDKIFKRDGVEISNEHFNWRRRKIQSFINLQGDEWKFFQEYPYSPIEAFQARGRCAFSKRKLSKIMDMTCADPTWVGEVYYNPDNQRTPWKLAPFHEELPTTNGIRINMAEGRELPPAEDEGGRLRVWTWPEEGESYYMGADVALGNGGDFSCAEIIKIGHGGDPDEQVAEWHGWASPTEFAAICAALGFLYNECQIASEINNVGMATYVEISRNIEYPNLYRWKRYDKIKNSFSEYMGWMTTWQNRPLLISAMRDATNQNTLVIRSDRLVDEMMDFGQQDEDSRIEWQDTPDDRVFAIMIANWCAHDSDFGKRAQMAPRQEGAGAKYYVFDEKNRCVGEYPSKDLAYAATYYLGKDGQVHPHPGWSFRGQAPKRDFANTDYSPVHDRPGILQDMHYKGGVPAERLSLQSLDGGTVYTGTGGGRVLPW